MKNEQQQQQHDRNIHLLTIGGHKGHETEHINIQNNALFIRTYNTYRWKMIPNCTGRYTCRDHKLVANMSPDVLLRRIIGNNSPISAPPPPVLFDEGTEGSEVIQQQQQQQQEQERPQGSAARTIAVGTESLTMYYFEFPHHPEKRKDPIIVIPFDERNQTGLITYIKQQTSSQDISRIAITNGRTFNAIEDAEEGTITRTARTLLQQEESGETISFVHTLNAPSGFQKKLEAIGITVTDENDIVQKRGTICNTTVKVLQPACMNKSEE